jgi:amidase
MDYLYVSVREIRRVANLWQGKIFNMDGGADVKYHLGLSGEPQAPEIVCNENGIQMTASEIAALNVAKREYQKQYMDYWDSTAEVTGTGRPVDALFCPLAPHAAVIPGEFKSVGYTGFVNVLDYTSLAIPVTFADKKIDVRSANESVNDSELIQWDCGFPHTFTPVVSY